MFALALGQTLTERRQARHNEAINRGQYCGWRSLAATIVCQGVQRAMQHQHAEDSDQPVERFDTIENARLFVLGAWARYLLCDVCDLDPLVVEKAQATWTKQWAEEARQYARETAQHEAIPTTLMPDWYLKEKQQAEQTKQRNEEIWGRSG